jgi:hypothetical protein
MCHLDAVLAKNVEKSHSIYLSSGLIINQCKGSKAIIKALTNYVVEVEYKEAYLIFELSSQFTFIAKNKAFYRQEWYLLLIAPVKINWCGFILG